MANADKVLKILVIEDESLWRENIGEHAELLGYEWEGASSLGEAVTAIKAAETKGAPFSVATVDMGFIVGSGSEGFRLGQTILEVIKSKHPYIACIVVTGRPDLAAELLDARDECGPDSYLSKDRFDLKSFRAAIAKAMKRMQSRRRQRAMLESSVWMKILAGAATILYTEIGALLKERREARQAEKEASPAPMPSNEGPAVPQLARPISSQEELIDVLATRDLGQYEADIDRVQTLQELIRGLKRSFNDFELAAQHPGLSIDSQVGVKQKLEDLKLDIRTYGLELQQLLEGMAGRPIEV